MSHFDAPGVISRKRDGEALSEDQIRWFIQAYTEGEVADEQAAALCMAVYFRGMSDPELVTWTRAMIDSGTRLDLSGLSRPTVDKHSTGGVGDKVSLILCPLLAACGAAVPQLSGRGLGHTGGTLDKMEAIPGWRAELSEAEILRQLDEVGAVIAAATESIAPADRKLYRLRDVTGTVPSIPLISSSIMSKKIAEGTESLILDVKVGSGAFLPDPAMARQLAETMVRLGTGAGVKTRALLTAMDAPLGRTVGNALEVVESVETLDGGGPADLREVTLALAREALELAGLDGDPADALDDGRAMQAWRDMVQAQGGDPDAPLSVARETRDLVAERGGIVQRVDALAVGEAAVRLGAGRMRKEDAVDAAAGIVCHVAPGTPVEAGQPLLTLHASDAGKFAGAEERLRGSVVIGESEPATAALVQERVG